MAHLVKVGDFSVWLLSFLEVRNFSAKWQCPIFLVWTWNYSCPFWTSGLDCWISENVDIFPSRNCLQGCFRRHSQCHVCPVHSGAFWRYFVQQSFLTPNTYVTNSYFVCVLKMEYVPKITIFGLKMMVKSGLEKTFLKFLHAQKSFW